jgi:hypothetical protein
MPTSASDEEARGVDVARVDDGQAVHQRHAEVEVGAVPLVGELAQLRVAPPLRRGERVGRRLARARGLLLLRRRDGLGRAGRSRRSRGTWASTRKRCGIEWRQAEADAGTRNDRLTTSERERLKTLERENRELRRAH